MSNFYYVKQEDEDALTAVLAIKGPVAIAINAGLRSFQFYSSKYCLELGYHSEVCEIFSKNFEQKSVKSQRFLNKRSQCVLLTFNIVF